MEYGRNRGAYSKTFILYTEYILKSEVVMTEWGLQTLHNIVF
jgi:hypothetical protein